MCSLHRRYPTDWIDAKTLFQAAAEALPGNCRMIYNYASLLDDKKVAWRLVSAPCHMALQDLELKESMLRQAIAFEPTFGGSGYSDAYTNLGLLCDQRTPPLTASQA